MDLTKEVTLAIIEKVLHNLENKKYENYEVIGGSNFNPQINSFVILPLKHPHGLYMFHTRIRDEIISENGFQMQD